MNTEPQIKKDDTDELKNDAKKLRAHRIQRAYWKIELPLVHERMLCCAFSFLGAVFGTKTVRVKDT